MKKAIMGIVAAGLVWGMATVGFAQTGQPPQAPQQQNEPAQQPPTAPMPGMALEMPAASSLPGMGGCPKCQEKMKRDDDGRGHGGWGKGGDLKEMLRHKMKMLWKHQEDLGITAEQMASIQSLKAAVDKDLIQKDAGIEVIGIDLTQKMMEDPIDVKAVNVLLDKKYEAKKAAARSVVNACAELKKILTDEQKQNMKKMMMGQGKRND